jgi:hypothetical protein
MWQGKFEKLPLIDGHQTILLERFFADATILSPPLLKPRLR